MSRTAAHVAAGVKQADEGVSSTAKAATAGHAHGKGWHDDSTCNAIHVV